MPKRTKYKGGIVRMVNSAIEFCRRNFDSQGPAVVLYQEEWARLADVPVQFVHDNRNSVRYRLEDFDFIWMPKYRKVKSRKRWVGVAITRRDNRVHNSQVKAAVDADQAGKYLTIIKRLMPRVKRAVAGHQYNELTQEKIRQTINRIDRDGTTLLSLLPPKAENEEYIE